MPSIKKKITHLYWRAGFGISLDMLDQKSVLPLTTTINQLFEKSKKTDFLEVDLPVYREGIANRMTKKNTSKKERKIFRKKLQIEKRNVNNSWIEKMARSENPLLERMTLFWHGHFALVSKGNSFVAKNYINTLRKHALGNFKDLVLAMARDPEMIRFLNNQQNRKGHPNENFARELLELFMIGIDQYSEQDVKEAARAFTGWKASKEGVFEFSKRQHDYDEKIFMGQTGNFDGEDIIKIVLEKKQTARFIATKVYQYFVNEKINKKHLAMLTDAFYNSDYNIETLMRTIFESDWFYAKEQIGTKIKSPIDLLVGMIKTLQLTTNHDKSLLFVQKMLGQILLIPPNVAGWPGGKEWIDNATLLFRLNLAGYIFKVTEVAVSAKPAYEEKAVRKMKQNLSANMDLSPILKYFKKSDEDFIFLTLKDWLIQTNIDIEKSDLDQFTNNNSKSSYVRSLILRLMTLPEYQVC